MQTKKINPVDYYNSYHLQAAVELLLRKEPSARLVDKRLIEVNGMGDEIAHIRPYGDYLITEDKCSFMITEQKTSPFMILTKYKFKDNHIAAMAWVGHEYISKDLTYMRVGTNFYHQIIRTDRFGIDRMELARWTKDALLDDYGRWIIPHIPRYEGFITEPNNLMFQPVVNGHYNMYNQFSHTPKKGKWVWTERLMRHVFGDQYDLGISYLKVLYEHPKQMLPILVLASVARQTGKTTFLNWLSILFGQNMVVITPQNIENSFNSSYAHSNIVGIEETSSDKAGFTDSLKNLSTTAFVNVNAKYVDNYKTETYFKFIITTNDTRKFMKVDDEEIRFWVREMDTPKFTDHHIDKHLTNEIPAFLDHLLSLPEVDRGRSRMVFTADEISTKLLTHVKAESRSWLHKEIIEEFENLFNNFGGVDEVYASPKDIKFHLFDNSPRVELNYIRRVLRDEMKMLTEENMRYYILAESHAKNGKGTPFKFTRDMFFRGDS